MSAYITPPHTLIADIYDLPIWEGRWFRLSECYDPTPDILPDFKMKHRILSACRYVGMVWPTFYIADKHAWHTYVVGMSAWFYNPIFFYSKIWNEQYGQCWLVGMSACRHVGKVWPPSYIADKHAWHMYIWCRHVVMFLKQQQFSKWNIGYCRHVGMSACRHGLTPPPILLTNTHDIHMVSVCLHVFITTAYMDIWFYINSTSFL